MSIVQGTWTTFSVIGNREDLADQIYNISPTDTPVQAAFAKTKATSTLHEWQLDTLAAAAGNAQIEGDDSGTAGFFPTPSATTRLTNNTQISRKAVAVSGTQQAVNPAGRKKEMVYQLMKRGKELRRDIEFILTNNQTPVPNASASTTTARACRPILSWYSTNTSSGTSGAVATSIAARTDGTQRALTESLVKTQIQNAWTSGGDVNLIMSGPFNKTVISGFTGNNTRTQDTTDGKLETAINVYVSDFGTHRVVANRFSRDRDLHLLTTDLWAISSLRPLHTEDVAKTGDAEKAFILAEYTLEARNEAGSALVADLTTS